MLQQARKLVDRPAIAVLLLMALALLVNAPYLTGGYAADDLLLINVLREDPLPFSRWRGLWSFDQIPGFTSLWWRDPDSSATLWRPVASLIFEGAVRLFGERQAVPLHLLSLLLHGWVGGGLYLLVRRLGGSAAVGALSGALFVLCEDHSMVVGWIATFTDLLCVGLLMAALLAHVAWLQQRRRGALLVSLLALIGALGCKESAAIAPLLLVLTSFVFPKGVVQAEPPSMGISALVRRAKALCRDVSSYLPQLAVLVLYLAAYKGLPLGEMHNDMYVDPFSRPGDYLQHLVAHLPVLWLATLSPVTPSLAMFDPQAIVPLALAGAAAFTIWLLLLWPLRRQQLVVWGMAAYLLALLPQLSADASERALYLPFVGAAIVLAVPAAQLRWPFGRRGREQTSATVSRRVRSAGWFALLGVGLPGLLLTVGYPWMYLPSFHAAETHAATARPLIEARQPEHVLVLTTAGMMDTLYLSGVLEYHRGVPLDLRVLSSFNGVVSVERLVGHSFVLRADRPGWLSNMFARSVRTEATLEAHWVVETDLFRATLLELTPDGQDVLAVRFDAKRPLDDPAVLWLYWTDDGFFLLDWNSLPPGERRQLTDSSDLWKSMS